jgi:hypothetical protein
VSRTNPLPEYGGRTREGDTTKEDETMKKTTYTATHPTTGEVFKRTTHRVYTHVVVFTMANGVKNITWCGRPDLAANASLPSYYGTYIKVIIPVEGV